MKILIISQYIAPVQAIASNRWTKLSKYLKKNHGVEITILTNKKNYNEQINAELSIKDKMLIKDLKYFDEYIESEWDLVTYRILPFINKIQKIKQKKINKSKINNSNKEEGYIERGWSIKKKVLHYLHVFVAYLSMKGKARKAIKKICSQKFNFDVLVSSYGPIWVHYAAKKLKKKYPDVLWIADFRDVYAGNPYETDWEFKKHKKFVSTYLKDADILTKVTDTLELYEGKGQRVVTLYNGYDPDEKKEAVSPDKFMFLYTGTVYKRDTDLTPIFKALKELINQKKINIDDVNIVYAGNSGSEFMKQIGKYELERVTNNLGVIQREDVIRLQQNAAILLQGTVYTEKVKALWTGKMFEYMMSGKPIVMSVAGELPSLQYKYIKYLGGACYEEYRKNESYDNLKQYIYSKYIEWKKTGNVTIVQDKDYVKQFAYPNIAEHLWKIIISSKKIGK